MKERSGGRGGERRVPGYLAFPPTLEHGNATRRGSVQRKRFGVGVGGGGAKKEGRGGEAEASVEPGRAVARGAR